MSRYEIECICGDSLKTQDVTAVVRFGKEHGPCGEDGDE